MDNKFLIQMQDFFVKLCIPIILLISIAMLLFGQIYDIKFYLILIGFFLCPYLLIYLVMYIFIKTKKANGKKKVEGYVRELPYNYSPMIASFLCDNYTEDVVDTEAIKLNLFLNGYLKFKEDGKTYTVTDKETTSLSLHEKYVYNEIKNKILNYFESFHEKFYKDMINLGLITFKKRHTALIFLLGIVIIFLISAGIMSLDSVFNTDNTFFSIGIIFMFVMMLFIFPAILAAITGKTNKKVKLTKLGKEHAEKWLKFKNFLEDYTLLKERDREANIIYKEYIPYSMAVGVGKKIEKEVFKEYWVEIYNKKSEK